MSPAMRRSTQPEAMPGELLQSLSEPQAAKDAMDGRAARIVTDLRNALAHGGVAYGDEAGRQTGGQAAMLAFVDSVMRMGRITGVNVLRVRARLSGFLAAWASWVSQAGRHCRTERTGGVADRHHARDDGENWSHEDALGSTT